jgi:hypothetical protein
VLAVGPALAGQSRRNNLRLILFGGEEQGLVGSRQSVSGRDGAERARISAVINMDMIACQNSSNATVLLEGAPASQSMIDARAGIAQANTSLDIQTSLHPFNSDHAPFLDLGIPAVLTIEVTDSSMSVRRSTSDGASIPRANASPSSTRSRVSPRDPLSVECPAVYQLAVGKHERGTVEFGLVKGALEDSNGGIERLSEDHRQPSCEAVRATGVRPATPASL